MNKTIEQLKDIRELEAIPDISFYLFLAALIGVFILILSIFFMILGHYKNKKSEDLHKEVLKRIKSIDFSNSKKAAYKITRYGRFLAKDERSKKLFEQLLERLEKYKYTPNPPKFDDEDIKYYDLFIGSLDE